MARRQKWRWIIPGIILLLAACIWTGNNRLSVSRYEVVVADLPSAFDGLRVVQISDLHSKYFGKDQARLAHKIETLTPDIILCTGDMVDSRRYREEPVYDLIAKLVDIAPVYMASGNHEWWTAGGYQAMIPRLEGLGATVLENETALIKRDGSHLGIIGMTDEDCTAAETYYGTQSGEANPGEPLTEAVSEDASSGGYMDTVLSSLIAEQEGPVLLISHRPEYFPEYVTYGADVVFSGHAHGGQIRLPFIGGLVAPGQGFFPRYDSGLYQQGNTSMVVSRGLGNSLFPVRVFNPPDVVLTILRRD